MARVDLDIESAALESAPRERALLERIRELDHAHRMRAGVSRSWSPVLRLHYLRTVARLWLRKAVRRGANPVPRPGPGVLVVTFVGHATVMLTSASRRVLTDPWLARAVRGVRRAEEACIAAADLADVDLVLLSHAHRDHLHLPSLRRLSRAATVVVPPRCARLVSALGFARVEELAPGDRFDAGDVEIQAVAARHDGGRGLLDPSWRGANGYVLRTPAVSAYFAGATGYFSGFAEIGRRLRPDVALLPISGYEPPPLREAHMSPMDALAAFEDLGAALLVPISYGSLPLGYEPLDEPLRWLRALAAERKLTERLRPLAHGESLLVRGA